MHIIHSNELFIKQFISKNRLKPLSEAYLDPVSALAGVIVVDGRQVGEMFADVMVKNAMMDSPARRAAKAKVRFRWPFPFPGGIKGPHIHFQEDVYILNDRQWRVFSNKIIKDIQSRIATANSINFSQLVELSEATGGMV